MTHGTRYAYTLGRCRCAECRAWNATQQQQKRQRRRERDQ